MIKEVKHEKLNRNCEEVNITVENGLFHSVVLNGGPCLIRNMVDTILHQNEYSIILANQIGYLKKAMVVKAKEGLIVMLNPVVTQKSGKMNRGYYKKVRIKYTGHDGFTHSTRFEGNYSPAVQYALEILGCKI